MSKQCSMRTFSNQQILSLILNIAIGLMATYLLGGVAIQIILLMFTIQIVCAIAGLKSLNRKIVLVTSSICFFSLLLPGSYSGLIVLMLEIGSLTYVATRHSRVVRQTFKDIFEALSRFSFVNLVSLMILLVFCISKLLHPFSELSWFGTGDSTNWFVIQRHFAVGNMKQHLMNIAMTPGEPLLANSLLTNYLGFHQSIFLKTLQSELAIQLLSTLGVITILNGSINKQKLSKFVRWSTVLIIGLSGVVLGWAQLNGFLSVAPAICLLVCILTSDQQFNDSPKFLNLLYFLSAIFLSAIIWPLIIPVVVTWGFAQTSWIRRTDSALTKIIKSTFATVIFLLIFFTAIVHFDRSRTLTIVRGGFDQKFNPYPYFVILIILVMGSYNSRKNFSAVCNQVISIFCVLFSLFLIDNNRNLWGPWDSYYPQKFLAMVTISMFVSFGPQILKTRQAERRNQINSFTVFDRFLGRFVTVLLVYYSTQILSGGFLETTVLNLVHQDINTSSSVATKWVGIDPNIIAFTNQRSINPSPYGFWHFYSWPSESSAIGWSGVVWEPYLGNLYTSLGGHLSEKNFSGIYGNRSWHNGNPDDVVNLCETIRLLPDGSTLYTQDPLSVKAQLLRCVTKKQVKVLE